jgi:hypothetical protein
MPVAFPVANLHEFRSTMRELLEQQHTLQELGTSQKRFQAFFFCVWWDSYWAR